jgi:hypothetical protein
VVLLFLKFPRLQKQRLEFQREVNEEIRYVWKNVSVVLELRDILYLSIVYVILCQKKHNRSLTWYRSSANFALVLHSTAEVNEKAY